MSCLICNSPNCEDSRIRAESFKVGEAVLITLQGDSKIGRLRSIEKGITHWFAIVTIKFRRYDDGSYSTESVIRAIEDIDKFPCESR